jgi:hypothetical protein
MLEQHQFPVEEAISSVIPLDDAPRIFRAWSGNPAKFSKILVSMD